MILLAIVSVTCTVLGPKILGNAVNIIFEGAISQNLPAGATQEQVIAAARAAGENQLADMLSTMHLTPGVGIDFGALAASVALLIALYVVSSIFAWLQGYVMAGVTQRTVYRLRADIDQKLGRLPLRYFDGHPRGDLLSRVTNDIDNIGQSLQQSLTQLITSLLTIVGVLVLMVTISPLLAVISLLAVPASLVVTVLIIGRSQKLFAAQWASTGTLNGHVEEMHTGHAIVKAFGRQRQAVATFDEENERLYQASYRAQFISGIIQPAMNFISNLNYVAIAVIGGLQVAAGQMSLGDVVAFIQYSRQFTFPIIQTASIVNVLQSAVASAERVFELLDEAEEIPDPVRPAALERAAGAVAFADVSFRYEPDRPLIDDLDLVVEAGRTVAIVGPTGAGKTTLVNLLMRFYEIDAGQISVDGIDIRDLTRDDLRRQFGMVLQDTWLFHGTIRENIAYSRPEAARSGHPGGGRSGPCRPLRPDPARRLRHGDRRRCHQPVGRREAVADDRASVPGGPADPHPRRGDEFGRHQDGGPHPAGDDRPDARPHDVRDRAPALDHPRRPHDPRHGPWPDRRAGRPRNAPRAARVLLRALQQPVRRAVGRGSLNGGPPGGAC